jgi:cyclophilin family peptidyl-prolyl cis-trans isomerase
VEKPPANLSYTKGVVAMEKSSAKAPAGSSGSQFFIVNWTDAAFEPEFALLGEVRGDYEVVERIANVGTRTGKPKHAVLINKIRIEKR